MPVRPARREDLPAVRSVLERWLDDDEVDRRLDVFGESVAGHPSRRCAVALDDGGRVVGVAGLQADGVDPGLVTPGERAVELVSAYVAPEAGRAGVGSQLVAHLEAEAGAMGCSVLLVVSGSRDRERGHPFWRRRYGEPAHVDPDHFGPGEERVVWRTVLPLTAGRGTAGGR